MKIIRMMLGGEEVASVTKDRFQALLDNRHPFAFDLHKMYDVCFYGMKADTFEERYELVQNGKYFCYMKPSLKLIADHTE